MKRITIIPTKWSSELVTVVLLRVYQDHGDISLGWDDPLNKGRQFADHEGSVIPLNKTYNTHIIGAQR